MTQPGKCLHRQNSHHRGRDGASRSSDGRWTSSFRLPAPGQRHQSGAVVAPVGRLLRRPMGLRPQNEGHSPPNLAIDAEVDLNLDDGAYFLRARLISACRVWTASRPGPGGRRTPDLSLFQAIRNNVDVLITLV